jgi:hypothetical protein|nr:MAG TPA: hypothetical protein [Caudoviricetes sp.]
MAIKPILFNTEMVRAILNGRKDATRRIVKGFIPDDAVWGYTAFTPKGYISCRGTFADGYGEKFFKLPCEPGDILYVRETWMDYAGLTMYKADCDIYRLDSLNLAGFGWKPSIHMPKEAARIWLKVTDVRVERLQDITIDDIRGEGLSSVAVHAGDMEIALEEWKRLWNSTIKKPDIDCYGWDANPYVFVIYFIQTEKPEIRF